MLLPCLECRRWGILTRSSTPPRRPNLLVQGFNFNDGFGGGDEISENLLLNMVRESKDHGPWNSWDRVPYITDIRYGAAKPSITPADRQIHRKDLNALP